MARTWTDQELLFAVKTSYGITEVNRKLYSGFAGNNSVVIWRRIAELKIDTSHFTQKRPRSTPKTFSSRMTRKLMEDRKYECEICKNPGIHLNKKLTLHVDHIDGDRFNNESNNLRWLCPNCHSQTPTWGKPKQNIKKKELELTKAKCDGCRLDFNVDKWRYERKKEKGQTKFFCSLKCAARPKVSDTELINLFKEFGSQEAVARYLGVSGQSVNQRIKRIQDRI